MKLRNMHVVDRESDRVARKVAKMEQRWSDDHQALIKRVEQERDDMLASGVDERTATNIANWKLDRAMALEAAEKWQTKQEAKRMAEHLRRTNSLAISTAWQEQLERVLA